MLKNMLLATCFAFIVSGCFWGDKVEEWNSFIYPNKNETKKFIKSPMKFDTLQKCKEVSLDQIKQKNLQGIATYKCGLNCSYHEGMKTEVCEKMMSPAKEK